MGSFVVIPLSFLCVCVCVGNKICWFDVILSHIMNRNIITLTNEIVDPIDEMMIHVVWASGKS